MASPAFADEGNPYRWQGDDAPGAQAPQRSSRKWWLLLGCLPVGLLLVCGGGCGGIFYFVFGLLKSSEPYVHSLAEARRNQELIAAIGEPMEEGFVPSGNIRLNNDGGEADLNYTLTGPSGSATIHVTATKAAGQWTYHRLDATLSPGEVIDLRR